jgi:hypothetical protein
MSRIGKSLRIVPRIWWEKEWGVTANRHGVSFGADESALKFHCGDNCRAVCFKWVNDTVCEFQ